MAPEAGARRRPMQAYELEIVRMLTKAPFRPLGKDDCSLKRPIDIRGAAVETPAEEAINGGDTGAQNGPGPQDEGEPSQLFLASSSPPPDWGIAPSRTKEVKALEEALTASTSRD